MDLMPKALCVICERPELIENLWEEITSMFSSLYNLHLMNSVIEEIQRINVLALRWRDIAFGQEYERHYQAINVGCYKQAFSMIRNICKSEVPKCCAIEDYAMEYYPC